jgi:multiple RNA-binding domain-containing protein 1
MIIFPLKISDEKFREHFSKVGTMTESKLKYTKDGKFRQFGFVGFKSEEDARKAIDYYNNTYIDASKIQIEECRSLNDPTGSKTWSKHSVKTTKVMKASDKGLVEVEKEGKKASSKDKKLDMMLGDLKDDSEFKEFLAANNAIKLSKENVWKNDISLGLKVEEEKEAAKDKKAKNKIKKDETPVGDENNNSEKPASVTAKDPKKTAAPVDEDIDFENGRLFIRNLSYTCKEEDIEKLFEPYAPLVETSMPIDHFSKTPKGFAYVQCMFPEKAIKAFNDLDGTVFQGRMLHIIPAKNKIEVEPVTHAKTNGINGYKAKKETELRKSAHSSHNWNSLFVSQDAVANIMSSKYNLDKSQIYDVYGTKKNQPSAAVKLAVGETQIVDDIRKFLVRNGVKLDAFGADGNTERSKTCMLIKNLPNNTTEAEIRELFKKNNVNGDIRKFVMPDYGIAALVEFSERQEARDAFKKLVYKKFKSVPIYLEWAPVDVFDGKLEDVEEKTNVSELKYQSQNHKNYLYEYIYYFMKDNKQGEAEVPSEDDDAEYEENATIFVKNLNFDTTEDSLKKVNITNFAKRA